MSGSKESNQIPPKGVSWVSASPSVGTNQIAANDENNLQKNPKILPATTNKRSPRKMQTQISKLVYDPPTNLPTQAIVKSIHTFGHVTPSPSKLNPRNQPTATQGIAPPPIPQPTELPINKPQLDLKQSSILKSQNIRNEPSVELKQADTFRIRDVNKCPEKRSVDLTHNKNPALKSHEFVKKKLEREKDIEDIQKMLHQISMHDIESASENISNINLQSKTITEQVSERDDHFPFPEKSFKRSKTDITIKPPNRINIKPTGAISRNQLSPTKTTLTQRSKSSINLLSVITSKAPDLPKKKSYDPDEARRFMQEQRRKRKLSNTDQNPNEIQKAANAVDKAAIKKRLEDLRKSSLKILEKNLKPSKKRAQAPQPQDHPGTSPTKARKIEMINERRPNLTKPNTKNTATVLKPFNSKSILKLDKTPRSETSSIVNKKVGLLRKPETQDHSFSAIENYNINKENILLFGKTPNRAEEQGQKSAVDITDTVLKIEPETVKVPNSPEKPIKIDNSPIKSSQKDLHLKVPAVKLQPKVSVREKSIQVEKIPVPTESEKIPYWLKPTPVQIYPYNFIMAVRKKLEAITKTNVECRQMNTEIAKNQMTPLTYTKNRKETVPRRILSEKTFEYNSQSSFINSTSETPLQKENIVKNNVSHQLDPRNWKKMDSKKAPAPINNNNINKLNIVEKTTRDQSSKSISEMTSNFSSISIHMPESNTISEISSIRSEAAGSSKIHTKIQPKKIIIQPINSTIISHKNSANTLSNINNDDDTTISSSVFSSPEKAVQKTQISSSTATTYMGNISEKPSIIEEIVSPLSMNNISNLQIKSKGQQHTDSLKIPQIQLVRNSKSESSTKPHKNNHKVHSARSHGSINSELLDFGQLLNDFNKSLSQVIEVNDKLKATLDKSNHMSSPNSKSVKHDVKNKLSGTSIKSKTEEYTSDFEEELSKFTKSIENIEKPLQVSERSQNSKSFTIRSVKSKSRSSSIAEDISQEQTIGTASNSNNNSASLKYSKSEELRSANNSNRFSNTSQEFLDSIEELSKAKSNTNDISEQITKSVNSDREILVKITEDTSIKENDNLSPNKTKSGKLNSKSNNESLLKKHEKYINNHINNSRGDFNDNSVIENTASNAGPPAYQLPETEIKQSKQKTDSSVSNEFIAVLNRSDIEVSMFSHSESNLSETTLNYSSIGLYEQLLQNENSKSDQLSALLKMREKALMDRTKGQIAWLQVQKEKYRSQGLSTEITAIKKKQRAVLLKMEKERTEIKKLLQSQQPKLSNEIAHNREKTRSYHPKLAENISDTTIRRSFKFANNSGASTSRSSRIIRGFELETSQGLENILQKREEELRKRRAHVERLMEWHQRLDKEEEDVLNLEKMLYDHTSTVQQHSIHEIEPVPSTTKLNKTKMHMKLKEIDKSLLELQSISCKNTDNSENESVVDYVCIAGIKLNKLWRRLTGIKRAEKFISTKKYKLYKYDLENLYEEAKKEVLKEFENKDEIMELFEQSKLNSTAASSIQSDSQTLIANLVLNSESIEFDKPDSNEIISEHIKQVNSGSNEVYNEKLDDPLVPIINDNLEVDNHAKTVEHDIKETLDKCLELVFNEIEEKAEVINVICNNDNKISIDEPKVVEIINKPEIIEDSAETFEKTDETEIDDIAAEELNSSDGSETDESISEISQIYENISSSANLLSEKNHDLPNNSFKNLNFTDSEIKTINSTSPTQVNSSDNSSFMASANKIDEDTTLSSQNATCSANSNEIVSELQSIDVEELTPQSALTPEIVTENNSISLNSIEELENINQTTDKSSSLQSNTNIAQSESLEDNKIISETSKIEEELITDNNSNANSSALDNIKESISSDFEESVDSIIEKSDNLNNTHNQSNTNYANINFESPQLPANQTYTILLEKHTPTLNSKSPEKTDEYEYDFSGSETFLDDLSMPKFESTLEETILTPENSQINFCDLEIANEINTDQILTTTTTTTIVTTELEKRLIDLDDSLKGLHNTIDRALSPDKSLTTSPLSVRSTRTENDCTDNLDLQSDKCPGKPRNYLNNCPENTTMPDIINEVELRRRQQIIIESEKQIKQLENSVPPYLFVREIPNKPPPPYVPPAHGSPMTIIFPSEQRIAEIAYRRTKELYNEILKTENLATDEEYTNTIEPEQPQTSSSILDENITNIYERIILDVCKECMEEHQHILTNLNPDTYKNCLALFNPPDRLKYMQEFVHLHVRNLLGIQKTFTSTLKNSIFTIGRRKCDHVDEILIQELYEEELKWANFNYEEDEVKLAIIDEICNDIIKEYVVEEMAINSDIDLILLDSSCSSFNETPT